MEISRPSEPHLATGGVIPSAEYEGIYRRDVAEVRRTTPGPLSSMLCGIQGHIFRAVVEGREPIALECKRCTRTWLIADIEAMRETGPDR